jgi:hypothetical protein
MSQNWNPKYFSLIKESCQIWLSEFTKSSLLLDNVKMDWYQVYQIHCKPMKIGLFCFENRSNYIEIIISNKNLWICSKVAKL